MEQPAAVHPQQEQQPAAEQEIILPAGARQIHLHVKTSAPVQLAVDIDFSTEDGQVFDRRRIVTGTGQLRGRGWKELFSKPVQAVREAADARVAAWLAWAALSVYLIVRLVGLPSFPIYFFTDEAVQTNLAADLLRDGLHGPDREFLPTFFQNGSQYNLGVSVYLQVLPYFFFGKSIWVTRGTAVLATLMAAVSIWQILKKVFQNPYPWLGVLFLSITPTWFLHSRTAFETTLSTSFFAVFLYFYLRYRCDSPKHLYGAVIFGALSFYSYSAARVVMPLAVLLLFITDLPYHWSQRKIGLRALGLALLMVLPFARFLYSHPEASQWQMRLLGSVWVSDVSLIEKITATLGEYLRGLNPLYWFLPQELDLSRHSMPGYGHLLRPSLPLVLFGLAIAVRQFRSPPHRTVLLALLAAPAGAALVRLGITRVMFMVIPAAVLAALGTSAAIDWLRNRFRWREKMLSAAVFSLLVAVNVFMLSDTLIRGPLWYRNYSLPGMQYGAQQVFGEIKRYVQEQPDIHIVLSPSWANGTDVLARFFFPDPVPFELGSAAGYYSIGRPLDPNQLFILLPEEYQDLPLNYFSDVRVEQVLPYPDGQPGFYFVRLKYAGNIQELIAGELKKRHTPETTRIDIHGKQATVEYTRLDLGEIQQAFDGDDATLIRTWAVNPMDLEITLDEPLPVNSINLRVGGAATDIKIFIWHSGQDEPLELNRHLDEEPLPRTAAFELPGEMIVSRVAVEITNTNDPPEGHVHLWEITIQ